MTIAAVEPSLRAVRASRLRADVVDGIIDVDNTHYTQRVIRLEPDKINRLCGTDISRERMVEILKSLQFDVQGDDVCVPAFRADVEGMADLAEEVVRMYGLDKVPSELHKGGTPQGKYSPEQKFERSTVQALVGFGFFESMTYTFISPRYYDKIRMPKDSPLRNSIVISNPLGEDTSIMRTTTLPSMLETLSTNYSYRNGRARMYEFGKIFLPSNDPEQLARGARDFDAGDLRRRRLLRAQGGCGGAAAHAGRRPCPLHGAARRPHLPPRALRRHRHRRRRGGRGRRGTPAGAGELRH